jgi:hypothetical protein
MANIEGQPDHAAAPVKTVGLSPKAIAGTTVAALVGVVVTILNAVQENPDLLGVLPTWAQSLILLLVPPVIVWLATYQASPGTVVERN